MHQVSEASFMNELPFSLRKAGQILYQTYLLNELWAMRQGKIYKALNDEFHFTSEQWKQVLNAVILTQLPQYNLSSHLTKKELNKLLEIALLALDKPEQELSELIKSLENDSATLAKWLIQLNKMLA